jgi:sporulation protein YlmC with PRC-barrel domain
MKNPYPRLLLAALTVTGGLGLFVPVAAQVAGGTTTVVTSMTESTQLAMGWSVKKTLLGKTVYNDAGNKVGKVEDLIISPGRNVSYVIVGAGGFVGIGRHDVAVPVTQIQDRDGKLVMAGATKDMIKAMPEFSYAADTTKRDLFVAAAEEDVAKGRAAMVTLQRKVDLAAGDAKVALERDASALQADLKGVEASLARMSKATVARWQAFEVEVSAGIARLRKSTDKAAG